MPSWDASRRVLADGYWLQVCDGRADMASSSNVLEHVDDPMGLIEEIIRVTRMWRAGLPVVLPLVPAWGGHEMSPWHYLGPGYAELRYVRRYGRNPKHRCGANLFPGAHRPVLRGCRPGRTSGSWRRGRYHRRWRRLLLRFPGLREVPP
jgi:Methyltransferase domain